MERVQIEFIDEMCLATSITSIAKLNFSQPHTKTVILPLIIAESSSGGAHVFNYPAVNSLTLNQHFRIVSNTRPRTSLCLCSHCIDLADRVSFSRRAFTLLPIQHLIVVRGLSAR
jgi:hypothetical protein